MSSRKVLGRGLDALIPQGPGDSLPERGERIYHVPIDRVAPNPRQPRSAMEDPALAELAESIRTRGVLEPLIVTPLEDGRYQLIAGERRLRAAVKAGLGSVPVLLRDADGQASLEIALIENLQREDLNPVDEARAYKMLVEEFGRTHAEISRSVGKDRSTVSNLLRILRLPQSVLDQVSRGTLSVGHARVLLNLEEPAAQEELARRMVIEGWSVRQAERFGGHLIEQRPGPARNRSKGGGRTSLAPERTEDPEVARVEEALPRDRGAAPPWISRGTDRDPLLQRRGVGADPGASPHPDSLDPH